MKKKQLSIRLEQDVYREIKMLNIPGSYAEKLRTLIDWALEEYKVYEIEK